MRKSTLLILALCFCAFFIHEILISSSGQPPTKRSGAPGESTCTGCHSGVINSGGGTLVFDFDGGGTTYVPGITYPVTITVTDVSMSRFGFEATCLDASNTVSIGNFAVINTVTTTLQTGMVTGNSRQYIGHKSAGAVNSWTFDWTAPPSDMGALTFYFVGNATNNNFGTSGDKVYSASFVINPFVNNAPVVTLDTFTTTEDSSGFFVDILGSSSDIDGDPLSPGAILSPPLHGSALIVNNDSIAYLPNPNFCGWDSLYYSVCDPSLACDSNWAVIEIICTPDPPTAVMDCVEVPVPFYSTGIDYAAAQNDTDPENNLDTASVTIISPPLSGTVLVDPITGVLTYTPQAGFYGYDSTMYSICDSTFFPSQCDTTWVIYHVFYQAMFSGSIDYSGLENTPVNIQPDEYLADTSEVDLTAVTLITAALNGTTTIDPLSGVIIYTPDPSFSGLDSFQVSVCTPLGACDTSYLRVEITNINQNPVVPPFDTFYTVQDSLGFFIEVLPSATDPDGDSLSVTNFVGNPLHGTTIIFNNDSILYTSSPGYCGVDSFWYSVCDPLLLCDTGMAVIYISCLPNIPPVAIPDSDTLNEGQIGFFVTPLDNDSDPEGGVLSIGSITQLPGSGTVTINGDSIFYTPDPFFCGSDFVFYTACDTGGLCDTSTVVFNTLCFPDDPIAGDDFYSVMEDFGLVFQCLSNDIDPDGDLDSNSVILSCFPMNGTAMVMGGGEVFYTPNPDFFGCDTMCYTVADSLGNVSNVATINICVSPVNDPPIAGDDSPPCVPFNTNIEIAQFGNDIDPEGGALDFTNIPMMPTDGFVTYDFVTKKLTYDPDNSFSGLDTFTYEVCDNGVPTLCDTATIFVCVLPAASPPIAVNDSSTVPAETLINIDVFANDIYSNGSPTNSILSIITPPAFGTVTFLGGGTTGIDYQGDPLFCGLDTFEYSITDSLGLSDTALVMMTVLCPALPPLAVDDFYSTGEDQCLTALPLMNDSDPQASAITITSLILGPVNGTVAIANDSLIYCPNLNVCGILDTVYYEIANVDLLLDTGMVTFSIGCSNDPPLAVDDIASTFEDNCTALHPQSNDVDIDGDPISITSLIQPLFGSVNFFTLDSLIYCPSQDYCGNDGFSYVISDGLGGFDTALVQMDVLCIQDMPQAMNDTVVTLENNCVSITALDNDTHPDFALILLQSTYPPLHGTAIISGSNIDYCPDSGYCGMDSFLYVIMDLSFYQDTAMIYIEVSCTNSPPVSLLDNESTTENQCLSIGPLGNDSDPDGDPLSIGYYSQPFNGGGVTTLGQDSLYYCPPINFCGSDTIIYSVVDPLGEADTNYIYVETACLNAAPIANDDNECTNQDTYVEIDVPANDLDSDNNIHLGTVVILCAPQSGTATVDPATGIIGYTPNPGVTGNDSLCYTISDSLNETSNTGWVYICIIPVNQPPIAVDDAASTFSGTCVNIPSLMNDSDPDGNTISVLNWTSPLLGSITWDAGSLVFVYCPLQDSCGTEVISYSIHDGNSLLDTAQITIEVTCVNNSPLAVDDYSSTNDGVCVSIPALANDSDPEGDPLNASILSSPTQGTVTIDMGGDFLYCPTPGFCGSQDDFQYILSDGNSYDTANVYVEVLCINNPPVAENDTPPCGEIGSSQMFEPLVNDYDTDGLLYYPTLTISCPPSNGTAIADAISGEISYVPNPGFSGFDTLCYTISDTGGATSNIAYIFICVEEFNNPPFAINDDTVATSPICIEISPLSNDFDQDGDALTLTVIGAPTGGTYTVASNVITYCPDSSFSGVDWMEYQICDDALCDTASISISVSPFVNINKDELGSHFSVFPNPFGDNIILNYSGFIMETFSLELTDMLGRVLWVGKMSPDTFSEKTLDLSHLSSGSYILTILGNDLRVSKRIEKN